MAKQIFVSNRLPITVSKKKQLFSYEKSIGGLATGLEKFHNKNDSLWIGWPGIEKDLLRKNEVTAIEKELNDTYKCHPIFLTRRDIKYYYEGFSNRTIWPLFHYFQDKTEQSTKSYEVYESVNKAFFRALAPHIEKDTIVWIHDYQLMLLPKMIRDAFPHAKIGFFLHIPFPSYEIFRLLVWKKEILEGLLGADLIGFHTYSYLRHFLSSVRRILEINHQFYQITYEDRIIQVDAFPMGIDYHYFSHFNKGKIIKNKKEKIILSIDRLDYTKGIIERLRGYQRFLKINPKYHQKVKLYLIVAPSRDKLTLYDQLHHQIETLVSEINGAFGDFNWMPIWYLYQSFSQEDLMAYYQKADALLVTPLRDGMNLIAKEYIAARHDYDGMLIISETAGASSELSEAIIVNPNDDFQIAEGIKTALEMNKDEKRQRNLIMHERLKRYDVHFWAKEFIRRLTDIKHEAINIGAPKLDELKCIEAFKNSKKRCIFLDYDGTLMPFKKLPSDAAPTFKLKKLIEKIASKEDTDVVLISGRDRDTLDKWFKGLPIHMVSNHGLFYKLQGNNWETMIQIDETWKERVSAVLTQYADHMPGAFVQDKIGSLVFHYRAAEPEMVASNMADIKDAIHSLIVGTTLELHQGSKVIEVKDMRVNKGNATHIFTKDGDYDFVFVAGDDRTDEDMFEAQQQHMTVKIGFGQTKANYRLASIKHLIKLLETMAKI